MYWKISNLDPAHRDRLAVVAASQGGVLPDAYFRSRHNSRRLVFLGLALLGVAALGVSVAVTAPVPLIRLAAWAAAALTAFYGGICLLARMRSGEGTIKPFVLVTAAGIIKVGYSNGCVEGYQLRDATEFKKVTEYSGRQNYNGIAYSFIFPDGRIRIKEKDSRQIQRLDSVLARARAGEAKAGEPLLPDTGRPGTPTLANVFDPFSRFWIEAWAVIGAIICIAVLVIIMIQRFTE